LKAVLKTPGSSFSNEDSIAFMFAFNLLSTAFKLHPYIKDWLAQAEKERSEWEQWGGAWQTSLATSSTRVLNPAFLS
jgi:hypothetical protein